MINSSNEKNSVPVPVAQPPIRVGDQDRHESCKAPDEQRGQKVLDQAKHDKDNSSKKESESEDEEESEPDLRQTLAIFWDVINNRTLQFWFTFCFICKASNSINNNIASVYLTNDLGFPKETLSMIQVVCTPLNILFAFMASYLASGKPYAIHSTAIFIEMALNTYGVLVLLQTFPPVEEISIYTTMHVTILTLLNELVSNFVFVTEFAILMANTDKRISALHVTVLGSMSNLSSFLHKTYIFKLIDMFGIYYP